MTNQERHQGQGRLWQLQAPETCGIEGLRLELRETYAIEGLQLQVPETYGIEGLQLQAPETCAIEHVLASPALVEQEREQQCRQCGRYMNPAEQMLGPVCGKCCRANRRRVAGLARPRRKHRKDR